MINITLGQLNCSHLQLTLIIFPIQTSCSTLDKHRKTTTIHKHFHLLRWLIVIEYYRQLYGLPLLCSHKVDRYFISLFLGFDEIFKQEQLENMMNGWLSIYSVIGNMGNNLKFLFRVECLQ